MTESRRPALTAAFATAALLFPPQHGLAPEQTAAQEQSGPRRGTGLPVPRFVSLKSDDVNVRRGPGQDYDVVFTFVRERLPVEIIEEFDNWRKIRDSEGAQGWVFHSLLSGERTALVAPWETDAQSPARERPEAEARIVAYLLPNVIANVRECDGTWCQVSGTGFSGWVEQERLWGVYPDEIVED